MKTITVCNSKGGTGKTTTAIFLATYLANHGHRVHILDADPQGSATEWADIAEDNNEPLPFPVFPANARSIARDRTHSEYRIIDTPPGHPDIIDAALTAADHIIIPTSPSAIEVARMWNTLALACDHAPVEVLLTSVRYGTREATDIIEALSDNAAQRIPTVIPLRQTIKRAWGHVPTAFHGYDTAAEHIVSSTPS